MSTPRPIAQECASDHYPLQRLDFELVHALTLDTGEIANLVESELGLLQQLGIDPLDDRRDVFVCHPECRRTPIVELLGVLPNGVGATTGNVGDNRLTILRTSSVTASDLFTASFR